ncbi:hypothetical protein [Kribbella sp. NPDC051770]|uniref:hypothetical protein n=1 Tax=Kribbella sp. NPDC051770 TaxID=3155413 RepID=UPI003420821B
MEFLIPLIVVIVVTVVSRLNAQNRGKTPGTPSPRVQRLIERMQAQQGVQPQMLGQYTQPAGGQAMPYAQPGQFQPPQQYQQGQYQPGPFQQPVQFQQPQQSSPWPAPHTSPQRGVQARPSQRDLDSQVRELMKSGNEVAAVRLLSDELDLGIIDAQKRARALASNGNGGNAPGRQASPASRSSAASPSTDSAPEQETRYVGSSAFAESLFDTNRDDQETWASGWTDVPEPDDRSDMDELWQTVRDHGRSPGREIS